MSVCGNVYTRPQTCSTIRIYPPQVHPTVPPSPVSSWSVQTRPVKLVPYDEDEALALLLIELLRQ